ncbi:hypothetical protein C5B41_12935 [Acinetobacter ursingii]|nr:hypothetical protein C5B41_12935 [Acinetobacter ursingii]RSC22226.1 hypothetical protein EGS47_05340 [Acinetobacter sp. FDAARGOS_515]
MGVTPNSDSLRQNANIDKADNCRQSSCILFNPDHKSFLLWLLNSLISRVASVNDAGDDVSSRVFIPFRLTASPDFSLASERCIG